MKIYFIRHGESVANNTQIHSGWSQVPLTAKGEEDAKRAGRVLAGLKFDKIFSSDLKRAMQTCEIALPGAEYQPMEELREINVGFIAGKSFVDCAARFGEEYLEGRKMFEFAKYGGESYSDFLDRVKSFLKTMETSGYENVAAFCHGGFINTVVDAISGFRTERAMFACQNCSVSVFEFKDGAWRMLLWNYMGEI